MEPYRLLVQAWKICGLGLAWLIVGGTDVSAQGANRPNIIFILADDLGYGDLGCYGQKKIRTPNLDRLAAEGMRFTSAYAGSTIGAPSRAALLTGRHTGHAWIRGNLPEPLPLRSADVTVAEVLKQAGYTTAAIGKWDLGAAGSTGLPKLKGFDQWVGFLTQAEANNSFPEFVWRTDPAGGFDSKFLLAQNQNRQHGLYASDLFTSAALNFIRINSPDIHRPDRHFFLYLAYTLPHASHELFRRTGNGMEVPDDQPYTREDWPQPERNKAAMITRLDADVGKLLDQLKRLNVEERTILFFSSDNGPHREGGVDPKFFRSAGPWRGHKRDLYEGGLRVPMIVRWPGKIKAGTVSDFPWAFWDFLPTAAELAEARTPAGVDGQSIVPTLLGGRQPPHEFLYWEFHEGGFQQAVRMGDWKTVRPAHETPPELYNLKADPDETQNVADQRPDILARIQACLRRARTPSTHWPTFSSP